MLTKDMPGALSIGRFLGCIWEARQSQTVRLDKKVIHKSMVSKYKVMLNKSPWVHPNMPTNKAVPINRVKRML